jgi:CarboxypepD_reg-like domain/TonB dependent receptor
MLIRNPFLLLIYLLLGLNLQLNAQQTLKGTILDRHLRTPLVGANVVVVGSQPLLGATSDTEGGFRIDNVPLGRVRLLVSFIGYRDVNLSNIAINAGKQTDLTIEMDEQTTETQTVVVTANPQNRRALNELAAVSTRSFSVEETGRFAASINDPSRMATSFAGVVQPSDGNALTIRGNAPNGLLWRLEGVDVPNPNHFASAGSSGGGIAILSAQLLTHSDFSTGAFAAEYGNALSGVFDLKLRKGNRDKHEMTIGASFIGLEAAAEGPLSIGKQKGAYLVNYRYSTLTVLQKLLSKTALPVGDAPTNFQDVSFNIFLPTAKMGNFSLFGFGGISKQEDLPVRDTVLWKTQPSQRDGQLNASNTGMVGVTHNLILGKKTALKTVIALSGYEIFDKDTRLHSLDSQWIIRDNRFADTKFTASSVLNHTFSPQLRLRTGAYATRWQYDLLQREADSRRVLQNRLSENNWTTLGNAFAQIKLSPNWAKFGKNTEGGASANIGVHVLHLFLNGRTSVEPRMSLTMQITDNQSISAAYGRHGQVQPLGTYFSTQTVNNVKSQPNLNLDFTKADHFVLSYDVNFKQHWHVKPEIYYQILRGVPVTAGRATWFSTINQFDGFVSEALANNGKGENYGFELTVERFFNADWYALSTLSLYQSRYQASDNAWRPTRWNSERAATLLLGKEWQLGTTKKRAFAADAKTVWVGGLRSLPIDSVKSKAQKTTVYNTNDGYSSQLPDYIRLDLRVSLKRQYRRMTSTVNFDIQNATNRANAYRSYYEVASNSIKYSSLIRFTPILAWKLEF